MEGSPGERINRYLAAAGVGSRRAVERLVLEGRVAVNGRPERCLARRIRAGDEVTLDGRPVGRERPVYLLLHKPRGVVTSVRDPHASRTVLDLVDAHGTRVFPVGRLDRDTTGALLLTNDGGLAERLMHPRHGVEKTYEVVVSGDVSEEALERLRGGVELSGRRTAPARVRVLERGRGRTRLELVLHEGRKRQVRRMCEAVGHRALSLHRPRYAGLDLRGLPPGASRELTREEVEELRRAAG